jgi:hypothetical protein
VLVLLILLLLAYGGGIATNGGTVNLRNSIVAGNSGGVRPDVFGAFAATSTNNLIGDLFGSTGLAVTQELTVPLANVIAPTPGLNEATAGPVTYALVDSTATVTNPAIDTGDAAAAAAAGLTTDQRGAGFPRTSALMLISVLMNTARSSQALNSTTLTVTAFSRQLNQVYRAG